jgi:hypothetical protein
MISCMDVSFGHVDEIGHLSVCGYYRDFSFYINKLNCMFSCFMSSALTCVTRLSIS